VHQVEQPISNVGRRADRYEQAMHAPSLVETARARDRFSLNRARTFPILGVIRGCVVEAPQKRRENAEPIRPAHDDRRV
jgi:hypothetical protein